MKSMRGMRPQDIAVLLKIVCLGKRQWKITDLAGQLFISQSEVSQALQSNWRVGLLDDTRRGVHRKSLMEFLIHGIKYVYPLEPGPIVRGMPTAHSAPPLSKLIHSPDGIYVWPDEEGKVRGETIEPLYPGVPRAAKVDKSFYEMMALVDAIRVGKSRELSIASEELGKRILRS